MATPEDITEAQALRVRARWRDPAARRVAGDRIERRVGGDPTTGAWKAALQGAHPVVRWLDGDEPYAALPAVFPDGTTPRLLFSSHPFVAGSPWSIQPTSPAS